MYLRKHVVWMLVIMMMSFASAAVAQNLITNGDLEDLSPAFWYENETGGDLIWDWTEAYMGNKSLKIDKPNAGASASWMSANNANLYWNNVDGVFYTLTAHFKTENVPVDPGNDGLRVAVTFTFKDAEGNDIVSPVALYADQSAATMDWHEVTTDVLLTEEPAEVVIYCWMGGDATGTAWYDMVDMSSDPWTAGIFAGSMEEPAGWMSWSDGDNGFAEQVWSDDAYSGEYVVELSEADSDGDEMVFYSEPTPVYAQHWYLISVMVKTENMNTNAMYYPTSQVGENVGDRANLCFFYHTGNIWEGWNLTGGDQFMYFDQRVEMSDGWSMYWTVSKSPSDATGFSMRARFNSLVEGTVYFDNFSCVQLDHGDADLLVNGDLEDNSPFFYAEGELNGELMWTDAEAHMGNRSAMISKDGTGVASWMSDNQATTYWNNMDAVLYDLSAWMMTDGVNTDPANQDEMIGVMYHFQDAGGNDIVDPVFVAADQSAASMDWHEATSQVLLTEAPAQCYIELMMGTDATGTVYFDDVNFGSDPWTAGAFGSDFETPNGWMHWADGDNGVADYTMVNGAYSGDYVAKLMEMDEDGDEMVFYSAPTAVEPDMYYLFEAAVKIADISPMDNNLWPSPVMYENIADRANLCYFFHNGDIENSWNLTGGDQFVYFQQRETTPGWNVYRAVAMAPSDATGASIRARFNSLVQGEVWYDNFHIFPMDVVSTGVDEPPFAVGQGPANLPSEVRLSQNYPNPFNAQSVIEFNLPTPGKVQLEIYDLLGRRIARLVDDRLTAGLHQVAVNADELGMTASGVYFYRLNTTEGAQIRKMTFIK
ncbi:T9SS type A sorting domain-containing protein [bacterium]|nr:T9SS type A sorting domain-containing protein [bacterium]